MKTSELSGAALDWAVCKAGGTTHIELVWEIVRGEWSPSSNWMQGGPIIEREKLWVEPTDDGEQWWSTTLSGRHEGEGTTPLIAAMRCYVASKLGDEVEIPEELQ